MIYRNKSNRLGFIAEKTSKRSMVENLEMYIVQGVLHVPPQHEREITELFDELIDFGYETTEAGNIVYAAQTGHDDRVSSLALALWGQKDKRYPKVDTICV